MFLGEKIRKLRAARGWSSGRLAQESGISRGYLWQLEENPDKRPSVDILQKLAHTLGVPVSEFIEEPGQKSVASPATPPGLAEFVKTRGTALSVTPTDIEVMRNVHFRGVQPKDPEDWELLFLFLRKWARQ